MSGECTLAVNRPVHQMENLLDGAVLRGGGGEAQPFAVKPDETPAAYNTGAVCLVYPCPHEIFRIGKREQDRTAVMSWDEQKVSAAGFPSVVTRAGNIHCIAVVAFRRFKETGDGSVTDA